MEFLQFPVLPLLTSFRALRVASACSKELRIRLRLRLHSINLCPLKLNSTTDKTQLHDSDLFLRIGRGVAEPFTIVVPVLNGLAPLSIEQVPLDSQTKPALKTYTVRPSELSLDS